MSWATAEYLAGKAVDLKAKSTAAFDIAISKNPDKVRTMLDLWFVPEFKPTFFDEKERYNAVSTTSDLDGDVSLLDPSYTSAIREPGGKEGRYPVRMFDLDTKRLVDYPDIGTFGQYCILSHSWKGREVNYRYAMDAKFRAYSRVLAAVQGNDAAGNIMGVAQQNDVDLIKHQCSLDITEQEQRITTLAHDSEVLTELELSDASDIVEKLLSWRVDVQVVEKGENGRGGLEKAQRRLAEAIALRDYENMEDEVFKKLLGDFGLTHGKIGHVIDDQVESDKEPRKSESDVEDAAENLAKEKEQQAKESKKIQFFERHRHIREAVDELIGCIQRSKSVTKVEQALERAKEIFDKQPFPATEKRYLWIDSCCINRADDGEYARSISAMGEWYKNAQFCLVHLDTKRDVPKDSLADWEVIRSLKAPPAPNINEYFKIHENDPEWSTRAWTLQELVMSKATFYINSSWELLSRPVENLGPWYYLCPFVSLYTSLDTSNPYSSFPDDVENISLLEDVWRDSAIKQKSELAECSDLDLRKAHKLIDILRTLSVQIPGEIDMETARIWISRAVYVAASGLTSSGYGSNGDTEKLLDNLLDKLQPFNHSVDPFPREELARHAINILLKCLVKLIEKPVLADRSYVSFFGNAQGLEFWEKGLIRSHFSTHKVMSLVCGRDATVMTDRAYSLMGMLGVRFPTFPAEGLTKALTRLLDEVVISSNDVSVFNWSGKKYGSPIRGRSLYPSSPEAYTFGKDEARKKLKDQKLAELLQIERYDVMNDFNAISEMLVGTIMFVKDREHKNIPLLWVMEILRVIQKGTFERLKPHIGNIGKILKYIETAFEARTADNEAQAGSSPASHRGSPAVGSEEAASKASGSYFSPFSSLQSQIKTPSIPDLPSFKAPSFGRKKTETQISSPPPTTSVTPKSRGIGGFRAPSIKGFGRKTAEPPQSPGTPTTIQSPTSEAEAATPTSTPATPSLVSSNPSKHPLDEDVLSYIRCIDGVDSEAGVVGDAKDGTSEPPRLPPQLEEVLASMPEREAPKLGATADELNEKSMISPNPIILTSSGISGSFDVQRVVVSMPQPERLRRQIRSAVSPGQNITGWCTVSTGFAVVVVSFACPKRILERELDVVEAVESKVLAAGAGVGGDTSQGQGQGQGEEKVNSKGVDAAAAADGNRAMEKPFKVGDKKNTSSGFQNRGLDRLRDRMNSGGLSGNPADEKGENDLDIDLDGPEFESVKEEGNRVSRMIRFVQESDLSAMAGEWVLARFSGVPGAKWFLCYLELGSSGGKGDFYGHRIATDEIDFRNASPEMGLVKYWEYYMLRKKHRLCSILQKLMESRDWGRFKNEVGQSLTSKVLREARGVGVGVGVLEKEKEKLEEKDDDAAKRVDGDGSDGEEEDSDSETGGAAISDTLKEWGGMALTVAGAGLVEKFYGWRAERLEKNLSADVLKQFPSHMQTALESLDDNKDLMPSMFHSAKKIHMF